MTKYGKLSQQQLLALRAVAAGRVQWGNEYPEMARRRGSCGVLVFLIDGHAVYAGQHTTFRQLAAQGWIAERTDLLPMKTVPAQERTYRTVTGTRTRVLPQRQAPADDGWRAAVELTDTGRAALAAVESKEICR